MNVNEVISHSWNIQDIQYIIEGLSQRLEVHKIPCHPGNYHLQYCQVCKRSNLGLGGCCLHYNQQEHGGIFMYTDKMLVCGMCTHTTFMIIQRHCKECSRYRGCYYPCKEHDKKTEEDMITLVKSGPPSRHPDFD